MSKIKGKIERPGKNNFLRVNFYKKIIVFLCNVMVFPGILFCYSSPAKVAASINRGKKRKLKPIITSGLGLIDIDSETNMRKRLSKIKNRGFTVIWDASPHSWTQDILNNPKEIERIEKLARIIRQNGIGNAFGMVWELLLPKNQETGLKEEWLGKSLDPETGLLKEERRWNYGSRKARDVFRSRFISLLQKLSPREMFLVDEVKLGTPGPNSHYQKMSSYWTSPTYTPQALDSFRKYLKKKRCPGAAFKRFPVTTKKLAPCAKANMGLPAIPINKNNKQLLQEDNFWPDSLLWKLWYKWREDILTKWIDVCTTEATRVWSKNPHWLGTMFSSPYYWFDPALGINAEKIAILPNVDYIVTGYLSGKNFAVARDAALKHGKKWGTMVEFSHYGQEKGVSPKRIVKNFKYQVKSGSSLVLLYALANFTDIKREKKAKRGLNYMPEQVKAWEKCVKWVESRNGIKKINFKAK